MNDTSSITHLFRGERNSTYQRVARAVRNYNKGGRQIPADILLLAQLKDEEFLAHTYNPVLFAPTPAQHRLAETAISQCSHEELRVAVLCYLFTVAPTAIK